MIRVDGAPAVALPLPDRGLEFGDGLFETLLLKEGMPQHLELHLHRLRTGLRALDFPDCVANATAQLQSVADETSNLSATWNVLRLTVTRGAGPRGYAPPPRPRPRIIISVTPLERDPAAGPVPARLGVASVNWPLQPLFAGIKHLNRLEQVMAAREAQLAGCDEAVMRDQDGQVISVTAGNLFIVRDGGLLTPVLDRCGIAGTRRHLVLEHWAPALGLPAAEARLDLDDLERAEEVFYCNSVLGPRPVASLGGRRWQNHPVCSALHELCWSGRT
ncbi:MAG: aminodeoxychorismate lyase [Halioglobus sp.]|jgi:4-amino-4-deoxychorismate lyase